MKLIPTNVKYEGRRVWLEDGTDVVARLEYRAGEIGDRILLESDKKLPPREPVELKECAHGKV